MKKDNNKINRVLKGFFRNQYDNRIAVYCPDCKTWHQHGKGEGPRGSHCTRRLINSYTGGTKLNTNYDSTQYDIKVFTKTELKPYKTHILDLVLNDKEKKILQLLKVGF
jgi:hypothetical protein